MVSNSLLLIFFLEGCYDYFFQFKSSRLGIGNNTEVLATYV